MSEIIEKLLVIQQCDKQIRDLKKQSVDLPVQKQQEEARLLEHVDEIDKADQQLKHAQAEVQNIEVEVRSVKEQISKLKQQQLQLKSNEEFKAMTLQIENLENKIVDLEDQELVKMDNLELMTSDVSEQKADISKEKALIAEELKIWDDRLEQVTTELAKQESKRAELVKDVPADALMMYERMAERKFPAIVPIYNGTCGGCNMNLPAYVLYDAKKQDKPSVTCNFCGRFVYEN